MSPTNDPKRPLIGLDEREVVTLEWWNGDRKLTIYCETGGAAYVKVWGPNIFTDMETGRIDDAGINALRTWLWEGGN